MNRCLTLHQLEPVNFANRRENEEVYSIGEFSKIVGLPVKTIRYYHEQGLITPTYVDSSSGYRMFDDSNIQTARIIKTLRQLGMSIREIRLIIEQYDDDADVLDFLVARRTQIEIELERLAVSKNTLELIIKSEERARQMANESSFQVEVKMVEPVLVAAVRMRGKYSDCGTGFKRLGRTVGRYINGKAMLLCHDLEYKENDADFEVCMPVRNPEKDIDSVVIRELPGGQFATLTHKGPYDQIGSAYAKILSWLKENGHAPQIPSREVYIKGPGMIFKGNPEKYLTEIQMRIDSTQ